MNFYDMVEEENRLVQTAEAMHGEYFLHSVGATLAFANHVGSISPRRVTKRCGEIALLISDIDGTLVTPDKTSTPGAAASVRRLAEAGVGFTLVSSRPPRGMAALLWELDVRLPFGAFNGGSLVAPDFSILEAHRLSPKMARRMLALLAEWNVDAWVFAAGDWRLRDSGGPTGILASASEGAPGAALAS